MALTEYGPVRGVRASGVELFVEVPYGADTSGPRRFTQAQPPAPWTEVRDAGTWTVRAPQRRQVGGQPRQWFAVQGGRYAHQESEDCLSLSVWTPSAAPGRRRPVLVWLHGGGWATGHAGQEHSDGAVFAREHDAVVVAITHRLDAFGFLPLDRIGGAAYRGSGNQGLLDIVAGLRWVRSNIERFGGDPDRVTVMGSSGGGGKTSALLVMPEAQGLLHGAVCLSGVAIEVRRREDSEHYARRLIEELGGGGVGALVAASPEQIIGAQLSIERRDPELGRLGPIVDGDVLPASPTDIWGSGGGADVPVIVGAQRDEVRIFGGPDQPFPVELPEGTEERAGTVGAYDFDAGFSAVTAQAGADVSAAVDAIRMLRPGISDRDATITLIGDLRYRYPATVFAQLRSSLASPTYLFQLDWASPRIAPLGAPHGASVGLFFGNDQALYFLRGVPEGERLARIMSAALAAFMRTGSPDHDGLPTWPRYDPERRPVMAFGDIVEVVDDPDGALREAFTRIGSLTPF